MEFRVLAFFHHVSVFGAACGPSWKDIGWRTGIHPETVSSVVKRLRAKQLIKGTKGIYTTNQKLLQVPAGLEENGLTPREFRLICHVICTEIENGECSSSHDVMAKVARINRSDIPSLIETLMEKKFLFHIKPGIFRSRFYKKPLMDSVDAWQKDYVSRGLATGTFATEAEAIDAFLHTPLTNARFTQNGLAFKLPEKVRNVIHPDFTPNQSQTA